MLHLSHCVVDLDRRLVHGPETVALTCREAELLRYLAARPGCVVSRDDALREVFGYSGQVLSRAVDNVVRRLRAKIEADPDNPVHLLTDFGVGYRLWLDAEREAPAPVPAPPRALVRLSGAVVDLATGHVHRAADVVALVGNELHLLRELIRSAGRTIHPQELERRVWGTALTRSNRLRSLVWRLRSKIERNPDAPDHLVSRRGHGYRFVMPEAAPAEACATVLAASVAPDPTGDRTELLWRAAADLAERFGGYATNLACAQACLVFPDPADAARAAELLLRAVCGVRVGIATGEVRRVVPPGSTRPEYVGAPVTLATERCRALQAELPDQPAERMAAA